MPGAASGMFLVVVVVVLFAAPVVVAFGTVAPFFVGFVLVMPMVTIAVVAAVADKFLAGRGAAEMIVVAAMLVEVKVGLRVVDHYFPAMIKIEVIVAGG